MDILGFDNRLPIGIAVVAVATGVAGFLVDSQGFLGNLLAETTGIFAGILIALLIVERYADYHKEKQWDKVRKLTYNSIRSHLCDLTIDTILYFLDDHRLMSPIIDGHDHANPDTVDAMAKLISQLRGLPSTVSAEKSTSDLAVE